MATTTIIKPNTIARVSHVRDVGVHVQVARARVVVAGRTVRVRVCRGVRIYPGLQLPRGNCQVSVYPGVTVTRGAYLLRLTYNTPGYPIILFLLQTACHTGGG